MSGFDEFYRATRDGCFRALVAVTRDHEEAADLLAEAYTRAWERWSTVSRHPARAAWVMRTALNLHRDERRRLRRLARLPRRPERAQASELPFDPAVMEALQRLPRRQRQVVALRILADLDTAAAADVLGIAPSTVAVHLHRALGTLRGALDPVQEEPT